MDPIVTIGDREFYEEHEILARIAELHREHAGEMPAAAAEEWNQLNGVVDQLRIREERIAELAGQGRVESSIDTYQTRRPIRRTVTDEPRHRAAARQGGLKAIDRKADVLTARAGDALEEFVRDPDERDRHGLTGRYLEAVSSDDYTSAFWRLLRDPQFGHLEMSGGEVEAIRRTRSVMRKRDYLEGGLERAMSLTTTSAGFAVPFVLDPTVLRVSDGAINPYRAISNVEVIGVDEWRGVSSAEITASFAAEAAVASDNSPTIAQPVVSTEKAFVFVPFSIEIGQDWGGFQNEMAGLFADSKDVLEATKMALGSGTNEPFGVITGATTVFTASNTNSLVVADLHGVHNALGPRFRRNAVWTMNNAVADRIRQWDTAGGRTCGRRISPSDRRPFLPASPTGAWAPTCSAKASGRQRPSRARSLPDRRSPSSAITPATSRSSTGSAPKSS